MRRRRAGGVLRHVALPTAGGGGGADLHTHTRHFTLLSAPGG